MFYKGKVRLSRVLALLMTFAALPFSLAACSGADDEGNNSLTPAAADDSARQGGPVHIDDCFNGNAGPYDWVQRTSVGATDYYLRCGDPTKGVIHIADGHPFDGKEEEFLMCIARALGANERPGNAPNSTVHSKSYGGVEVVVVTDNKSHDVLTAYTRGKVSNNWIPCGS